MIQKILFLAVIFLLMSCNLEESNEGNSKVVEISSKENNTELQKQHTEKTENAENADNNSNTENSAHINKFLVSDDDIVIGDPDSKVVLLEYFSYTCPHCVHYHQKIFPKLKKKYIDTKQIAYVVREFIGNKQDMDAAVLARCQGEIDIYFKFLNVLLNQQSNWAFNKNYREILTNIGGLGGISPEKFSSCLKNQSILEILTNNTKTITKSPNFFGTPSFFINGEHFTNRYNFEELSKALDKELNISNLED